MAWVPLLTLIFAVGYSAANETSKGPVECQCWVSHRHQEPCEAGGFLPEDQCKNAGCCSNSNSKRKDGLACFQPKPVCHSLNQCHIEPDRRKPCDKVHHTAGSKLCQFRGCCYDESHTPSCYKALSRYDGPGFSKPTTAAKDTRPVRKAQSGKVSVNILGVRHDEGASLRHVMMTQLENYEESVAHQASIASMFGSKKVLVQCPREQVASPCGSKDTTKVRCVRRLCCWNATKAESKTDYPCLYPKIRTISNAEMRSLSTIAPATTVSSTTEEPYEEPKDELIPNGNRGYFMKTCRASADYKQCHVAVTNRRDCAKNSCCWDEESQTCYAQEIKYEPSENPTEKTDDAEFDGWSPFDIINRRYDYFNDASDGKYPISAAPANEFAYNDFSIVLVCPHGISSGSLRVCEENVTRHECLSMFCCWVDNPNAKGFGTCVNPDVEFVGEPNVQETRLLEEYPSIPVEGPNFWRPSLPERNYLKDETLMTISCPASPANTNADEMSCGSNEIFTRNECVDSGCCWRPWMVYGTQSACAAPSVTLQNITELIEHDWVLPGSVLNKELEEPHWDDWEDWSNCKPITPCAEEGRQHRSRKCVSASGEILDAKSAGEVASYCLGAALQERKCNEFSGCDAATKWEEWSQWSTCSESCSSGTAIRTRNCIIPNSCQTTSTLENVRTDREEKGCNSQMCAKWGDWRLKTSCDAECESIGNETFFRLCERFEREEGRFARFEQVVIPKSGLLVDVDLLSSSQPEVYAVHAKECYQLVGGCYNGQECKYRWGEWTEWTKCDSECTPGKRTRSRDCLKLSSEGYVKALPSFCNEIFGGKEADDKKCGMERCERWGDWNDVGKCDAECDKKGVIRRERLCNSGVFLLSAQPEHCFRKKRTCDGPPCPAAEWDNWGQWSACSDQCSPGIATRGRRCMNTTHGRQVKPTFCAGDAVQLRDCNLNRCRQWSELLEGDCEARCGRRGKKVSRRTCLDEDDVQMKKAVLSEGPVFCHTRTRACLRTCEATWGEWSEFSKCSDECSVGHHTRTRSCYREDGAKLNSRECPGGALQERQKEKCNTNKCEKWNRWNIGKCTGDCRMIGNQHLNRTCEGKDQKWLVETYGEDSVCFHKTSRCRPKCARWGEWTDWTQCSDECGPGISTRRRMCTRDGERVSDSQCRPNQGKITQENRCNMDYCTSYGPWVNQHFCDGKCGESNGTRIRKRDCYSGFAPSYCLEDRISCKPRCGPGWGPWTEWSSCSEKCGPGKRSRTRTCYNGDDVLKPEECMKVKKNGLGGGEEIEDCNQLFCNSWTRWQESMCVAECNKTGSVRRSRRCTAPSAGYVPNECWRDLHTCIGKCVATWGQWTPWTLCSSSCTPGRQTSVRRCTLNGLVVDPRKCEKKKPKTLRVRKCSETMCNRWSKWKVGKCAVKCGGAGIALRERKCLGKGDMFHPSQPADKTCFQREELCGTDPCPNKYEPWSDWGECSTLCSPGVKKRFRKCVKTGVAAGDCSGLGPAVETQRCNIYMCKTWRAWQFTSKCESGSLTRKRKRTCAINMSQSVLRNQHPEKCYKDEISCK